MYVIFEDGSRQYRVSEGELVTVDHREGEPGSRVEFSRVLMMQAGDGATVGRPTIAGARVLGEVVEHPSIKHYIQKYKKRKNYRRFNGHRQHYTAVKINHILGPGQEPPAPEPKPETSATAPAGATPPATT